MNKNINYEKAKEMLESANKHYRSWYLESPKNGADRLEKDIQMAYWGGRIQAYEEVLKGDSYENLRGQLL